MWCQTLAIIALALTLAGLVVRSFGWLVRWRGRRRLGDRAITRAARGRSLRVLVQGTRVFEGMSTTKANRTVGDLWLAADAFVLACNRGVLVDATATSGRTLTSARCTGPGRLVLEGEVATPEGPPGLYRVEAQLDDAEAWAAALQPFVQAGSAAR